MGAIANGDALEASMLAIWADVVGSYRTRQKDCKALRCGSCSEDVRAYQARMSCSFVDKTRAVSTQEIKAGPGLSVPLQRFLAEDEPMMEHEWRSA